MAHCRGVEPLRHVQVDAHVSCVLLSLYISWDVACSRSRRLNAARLGSNLRTSLALVGQHLLLLQLHRLSLVELFLALLLATREARRGTGDCSGDFALSLRRWNLIDRGEGRLLFNAFSKLVHGLLLDVSLYRRERVVVRHVNAGLGPCCARFEDDLVAGPVWVDRRALLNPTDLALLFDRAASRAQVEALVLLLVLGRGFGNCRCLARSRQSLVEVLGHKILNAGDLLRGNQ